MDKSFFLFSIAQGIDLFLLILGGLSLWISISTEQYSIP